MYGFVYVLKNQGMKDLYKIGFTNNSPQQRAKDLSASSGVPFEFEVICYGEIFNAHRFEKELHLFFKDYRANQSREFFEMNENTLFHVCNTIREECHPFVEFDYYKDLEYKLIHGGK